MSTNPIVHFHSLAEQASQAFLRLGWEDPTLLARSMPPASPAHTAVTLTHGEPVRWENGSWKHHSPLILPNKLLPAWRSINGRSMILFMLKNTWNNLTEPENPTSTLFTRDITSKKSTAPFGIHYTLVHLSSCSLIPIRKRERKRISGYYRVKMVKLFTKALWMVSWLGGANIKNFSRPGDTGSRSRR